MAELDYGGLRYDVSQIGTKKILEAFPELGKIDGFSEANKHYKGDCDALVRYIVLMYDPGSPMASMPNVMEAKSLAAIEAGLPRSRNGQFKEDAEAVLLCQNKGVNDMILNFVLSFHSATYSKLVAYKEYYAGKLRDMLSGEDIKLADIDTLEKSINEMQSRLLRDNNPQLREALYEKIAGEQLKLRPEDIAEKMEAGEPPVDVAPYGEDYSFAKYKWKGVKIVDKASE